MTMKKKLLTTLSVVLILGLAALGILAYLTDTDSDVNVMTLGNVSIEQHEYQRVENADGTYATTELDGVTSYVLEDFEQGKALLPIVGDPSTGAAGWDSTTVRMSQVGSYGGMQVFAGKNAEDKFVVVKNTGKTDAYVRTLVAIEVGSTDGSLIGTSYHQTWTKNPVFKVEIAGNNYNVYEYVYAGGQLSNGSWRHENGILPAGDTAYPNLSQVYIKSEATNEDCAAIDGNGNGTLDILVLSQAVQAEGFADAQTALDTAFGVTAEKAAEWFGGLSIPPEVATAEELAVALSAGKDVVLTKDIDLEGVEWTPIANYSGNFDGNNKVIKNMETALFDRINGGEIKNLTLEGTASRTSTYAGLLANRVKSSDSNINIENVKVEGNVTSTSLYVGGLVGAAGSGSLKITFVNCVNNADVTGYQQVGGIVGNTYGNVTFDNCVNTGSVTDNHTSGPGAGGICGFTTGYSDDGAAATFVNCKNSGIITGTVRAGGICGSLGIEGGMGRYDLTATFDGCSNTGTIVGKAGFTSDICGAKLNYPGGTDENLTIVIK